MPGRPPSKATSTDQSTRTQTRRRFIATGAAAAGVATAGCLGGAVGGSSETVSFVLLPGEDPEEVRSQWDPVLKYLEDTVDGLEVEADVAVDYSSILPALKSGQADIAIDDATLLSDPDMFEVVGIIASNGTPFYFSLQFTMPEYDIHSLADVKGHHFAFADPLSTSGSFFPLYYLKEAGLDIGDAPDGEPVDFEGSWSGHHEARKALFNRDDVHAASNYGGAILPHCTKDDLPSRVEEWSAHWEKVGTKEPSVRVLNVSDKIPRSPIIMRQDWDADVRPDVKEALISIEEGTLDQYRETELELPITAVEKGTIRDYQIVIDVIDTLGVTLGQ